MPDAGIAETLPILVVKEARQTIVSPLNHVLRNAGKFETR